MTEKIAINRFGRPGVSTGFTYASAAGGAIPKLPEGGTLAGIAALPGTAKAA